MEVQKAEARGEMEAMPSPWSLISGSRLTLDCGLREGRETRKWRE